MPEDHVDIRFGVKGAATVSAALKQLGLSGDYLGTMFRRLGAVLATTFSVGAFLRYTQNAIRMADQMNKMAQGAGMAVEEFSALVHVANLAGVAQNNMAQAMGKLSQTMVREGRGGRSVTEEMMAMADQFERLPNGAIKTAEAIRVFGEDMGRRMIPILNQGSEALRRQIEEAQRFGVVISQDLARSATQYNDTLTRTKALVQGVFYDFAEKILPDLIKQLEALNRSLENNEGIVKGMTESYKFLANIMASLSFTSKAMQLSNTSPQGAFSKIWQEYQDRIVDISRIGDPRFRQGGTGGGSTPADGRLALDQMAELQGLIKLDQMRLRESASALTTSNRAREERLQILGEEKQKLLELQAIFEAQRPEQGSELTDQDLTNMEQLAQVEVQLGRVNAEIAASSNNLRTQMFLTMRSLSEQIGTASQIVARNFSTVIQGAIDSIANGIQGLIQGTLTWGEALRNIGSGIMNSIIQAIARMFAEWIVKRLVVSTLEKTLATQEAVAKAPSALMTSITSYGVAAAIGIAGLIAAIAALSGAFAEGGRPAVGRPALVGEKGPEIFVPDQPGTVLPSAATEQLLAAGGGQEMRVAFFDNRTRAEAWLRKGKGRNIIIDVAGQARHEFL